MYSKRAEVKSVKFVKITTCVHHQHMMHACMHAYISHEVWGIHILTDLIKSEACGKFYRASHRAHMTYNPPQCQLMFKLCLHVYMSCAGHVYLPNRTRIDVLKSVTTENISLVWFPGCYLFSSHTHTYVGSSTHVDAIMLLLHCWSLVLLTRLPAFCLAELGWPPPPGCPNWLLRWRQWLQRGLRQGWGQMKVVQQAQPQDVWRLHCCESPQTAAMSVCTWGEMQNSAQRGLETYFRQ